MSNHDLPNVVKVWYLNHSGFAIKTQSHFLIFDYYPGKTTTSWGELKDGLLNPSDLIDENVIVFSSHAHYDHFTKEIFELRNEVKNLHFVLSDDIKRLDQYDQGDILSVHFWKEYALDDVHIKTLHSTDVGVAFLVQVDGLNIYFAGDLNWWLWNGEDEQVNNTMGGEYRHEINSIKNEYVDIAFVPMDPRLEENYILGVDYFLKTVNTKILFPMHFWDKYEVFDWVRKDKLTQDYGDKIKEISYKGQLFELAL